MIRLRTLLASLALASAAAACTAQAARKPTTVEPTRIATAQIDRAKLKAKLIERRKQTVKNFLAYRDARVYPINTVLEGGYQHVWLDENGHLCAAATLVSKDWGREIAIRIGKTDNQLKIADATGELADWILTSGLTRAELVAIQVPGFQDQVNLRTNENARLYAIYVDVERQINSLWDKNLDLAVDELIKRPDLARGLLDGRIAGPGRFAKPDVG
jgi:hypothetical protein